MKMKKRKYSYFRYMFRRENYLEQLTDNERARFWRTSFHVMGLFYLVIILSISFISVSLINGLKESADSPLTLYSDRNITDKIHFLDDYSIKEKEFLLNIVDSLDVSYKLVIDNVYFTNNLTKISQLCGDDAGGCNTIFSRNESKTYVYTHDTLKYYFSIRRTLCHEILHNIIRSNENNHNIIYDLANKGVCYK